MSTALEVEEQVMQHAQTLFEWAEDLLVEENPDLILAADIYETALDLEQYIINGIE